MEINSAILRRDTPRGSARAKQAPLEMQHHVGIAFAGSLAALLLFLLLALPATVEAAASVNTASAPSGWITGTGANTITFSPTSPIRRLEPTWRGRKGRFRLKVFTTW